MKMLRKIIDSKSFENSEENIMMDGFWFNKVAILQPRYCNPVLNIITKILSGMNLEWPTFLKRKLWKKSPDVFSLRLYQIFTRLRPGRKQTAILQKAELIDLWERCKYWCSCKKTSFVKTSSQLSCWSRVYSCNFIKSRLHHRGFSTWVLQDSSS